jgi:hypothetical protein
MAGNSLKTNSRETVLIEGQGSTAPVQFSYQGAIDIYPNTALIKKSLWVVTSTSRTAVGEKSLFPYHRPTDAHLEIAGVQPEGISPLRWRSKPTQSFYPKKAECRAAWPEFGGALDAQKPCPRANRQGGIDPPSLKVIEVAEIETTVAGNAIESAKSRDEGEVGATVAVPSPALQIAASARMGTIRRVDFLCKKTPEIYFIQVPFKTKSLFLSADTRMPILAPGLISPISCMDMRLVEGVIGSVDLAPSYSNVTDAGEISIIVAIKVMEFAKSVS